jgi:hypothetical protein
MLLLRPDQLEKGCGPQAADKSIAFQTNLTERDGIPTAFLNIVGGKIK